jgi:cytochrome c553
MTLPQTLARAAAIAATASLLAASTWAADHSRAVQIVEEVCSVCHGSDGESGSPAFPRLAGQHAVYVERQLRDYKSGKRKSRAMSAMVEDLKEEDFKALGAYFESRATHKHEIEDPDLAGVGRLSSPAATRFRACPHAAPAMATTAPAPTNCRGWLASTPNTWNASSRPLTNASAPTTTPSCMALPAS